MRAGAQFLPGSVWRWLVAVWLRLARCRQVAGPAPPPPLPPPAAAPGPSGASITALPPRTSLPTLQLQPPICLRLHYWCAVMVAWASWESATAASSSGCQRCLVVTGARPVSCQAREVGPGPAAHRCPVCPSSHPPAIQYIQYLYTARNYLNVHVTAFNNLHLFQILSCYKLYESLIYIAELVLLVQPSQPEKIPTLEQFSWFFKSGIKKYKIKQVIENLGIKLKVLVAEFLGFLI